MFWPNLRRLWQKTNPFTGEANWGHAVCVPAIGLYYLYVHRDELIAARGQQFVWGSFLRFNRFWAGAAMALVGGVAYALLWTQPSIAAAIASSLGAAVAILGVLVIAIDWSLGTTIFGIGLYVYGIYPGQNDYLKDLGMVIALFGIVLLMYGWNVMRVAWFPIVFLICAIPWPGLVYSWVAGPLQQLAANVAVEVLRLTGVNASSVGTKIIMAGAGLEPPRMLNVAEACAGLRSLMTFISVGAAVAFLSNRPLWQKIIITVSAVPIAIFCNVMRVSGQGLLDHYVSQKLSESFAHQFVGLIMLLPAFFLILLVGVVLDNAFIEEADDEDLPAAVAAPILSRVAAVRTPAIAPAAVESKSATPPRPIAMAPLTNPRQRPVSDNRPGFGQARIPPRTAGVPPRPSGPPQEKP